MSGHSKWATIHRQKGVKDAKRGAAFTKLANAITIAVREGGGIGDPDSNFRLRLAVDKARQANMPKENISRAIERGVGNAGGETFESITYEGFGPGGAAVLVEVATDNRLRTQGEVRSLFDRGGGTLGGSGSVGYMFARKGYLLVELTTNVEETELKLMDLDVSDLEIAEDGIEVYCDPMRLNEVKHAIEKLGLVIKNAELVMVPTTPMHLSAEEGEKLQNLLEKLHDLDDVQKVFTNAEFDS